MSLEISRGPGSAWGGWCLEIWRGPDWDAVGHEVLCPLCDYNLRGLAEARCPECGYRFVWAEILDPRTRVHPYLFENHPERNVWSFVRTLVGSLNSVRFFGRSRLRTR